MMKLSQIKQILAEGAIKLTKSLGQNFLHDANQVRRLISAAELTAADQVLEVGPGLGSLTELLAAQAGRVLAIEKDGRLYEWLQQHLAEVKNLTLLHDDALDYLQRQPADWVEWKLVANLPYSVATPILVELAGTHHGPSRMVFTLQWEVARRLMANPTDKDYGVLALLVQLRYQTAGFFKIPTSCFFPEPDVESACVTLDRRGRFPLTESQSQTFTRIVKRCFSQRRKMMLKLLKVDWPMDQLTGAFTQLGLSCQVRAEAVSLDQFVALTKWLTGTSGLAGINRY